MTGTPFLPVGDVARWRIVYGLMRPLEPGQVLTYEAMAEALSLHPDRDRHVIQMATRRAIRELLDVDHRAADAVRGQGYRIAAPVEHNALAQQRNRRARTQLKTGHRIATKVDLSGLNAEQVGALELIARGFAHQMEINERMARKQEQHDEAINLLMQRVDKLEQGTADD